MKKLLSYLLALIIGVVIGVVGTVFFYPFIFPPPQVNEQVQNIQGKHVFAEGKFIHLKPWDPIHYGKGGVEIYQGKKQAEVFLQKDFEVGPGPAYVIYLSDKADIRTAADFKSAKNTKLGMLKSFKGSQVYLVPNNVDITKMKSVVVWCEAFGVLITVADLKLKN
ncbi:DM13 domain-containing protein [Legionella sp. W05-934-2]|jgi:predicted small secreted protein|uniref:DM13 domain-containing protein n=1 Tax=Legionella sp. W05-934-2 TaxID=1198649 RepID=UPI0034626531